jgi:hypothetical protein
VGHVSLLNFTGPSRTAAVADRTINTGLLTMTAAVLNLLEP